MNTNKKIKFVVPILATIFLFTIAAACTQCGQQTGAPTIKLEICDGPTYLAADDTCYYSVEAIVTGTPGPEIEFGEDDNVKSLGNNRVRVGVEEGNSFILTATATNTAGLASASVTLIGEFIEEEVGEAAEEEASAEGEEVSEEGEEAEESGEEEEAEEEEEEAATIRLEIYQDATYSPEDDICYYRIEAIVNGNPIPVIEFSKDDSAGAFGSNKVQINLRRGETYTLTATATNSEGSDSDSIMLTWICNGEEAEIVNDEEEIITDILICVGDESGTVISVPGDNWSGLRAGSGPIYIGDDSADNTNMGYMSFDISQLIGSTIISANLFTTQYDIAPIDGDNSFFEVMYLQSVYYGPRPLIITDNSLSFERLTSFPATISNINYSGGNLATSIQKNLNEGKIRYQIRLVWAMTTDGDKENDGIAYWPSRSFLLINHRQ